MPGLRRLLVFISVLGVVAGLGGLSFGAQPASAQATVATVSCTQYSPSTCTVTVLSGVAPGASFTATLIDGSTVSFNCPGGCGPGTTYTITTSSNAYTPAVYAPQTIYAGGQCIGNSFPTMYGCTSSFVPYTTIMPYNNYNYYPYYNQFPQYNWYNRNGCGSYSWNCGNNNQFPWWWWQNRGSGNNGHCWNWNGNQGNWNGNQGNNWMTANWMRGGNHC